MRISQAFSSYIKAADLQGREIPVIIDRVVLELIGGDSAEKKEKPVVYFRGKKLGWVLNLTNAGTIAESYGDETGDWAGREVVLFPAKAQFGREIVDAIRVRVPTARPHDHGGVHSSTALAGSTDQAPLTAPPTNPLGAPAPDPLHPNDGSPDMTASQAIDDDIPF